LHVPGETPLVDGWRVIVRPEKPGVVPRGQRGWEAWLDAEAVGRGLLLRPRRPGERFQPQGLRGHSVKLNEFMIDQKVHRDDRAGWPLLEGENGLAWVCGLRVDERVAVRAGTQAVWHVRFVHEREQE
jgi:tRNA(Ile)-lysidine synthase